MSKYYYLNGEFIPSTEASIGLEDIGLLRGFGIFDFFAVWGGKPLFIDFYLERFQRSAQGMGMELPHSLPELKSIIQQLLITNNTFDSGIRLVMTGGYSENSYTPTLPNFFILQQDFNRPDRSQYKEGIHLLLHRYTREVPAIKTTNYTVPILQISRLAAAGAYDLLYHDGEQVSESSRSNFFAVLPGKRIVTPKRNILEGITRQQVLEVAQFTSYSVEIADLSLADLASAEEAFLTSTTKGILPVVQIDGNKVGKGKVGPISKELMAYWEDYVEQYLSEAGFETSPSLT